MPVNSKQKGARFERYLASIFREFGYNKARRTALDKELIDEGHILITKVEYPDDVIECCINLCEWEVKNRGKVGIKAETLSRHSVTYFDQDASNQMNGYPVSLLGCLKPYRKARC